MLKNIHLESVEELQKDRTNIERKTKDESDSNYREQIQEDVLTAEKIGKICRAATDDHFPSLVESIRYAQWHKFVIFIFYVVACPDILQRQLETPKKSNVEEFFKILQFSCCQMF